MDFALLWLIRKPVVETPGEKILGLGDVMMTSRGSIEVFLVITPKKWKNVGIYQIWNLHRIPRQKPRWPVGKWFWTDRFQPVRVAVHFQKQYYIGLTVYQSKGNRLRNSKPTGKLRLVKQTSWLNVKYCFFDQIRGERAQSSQKSADAGRKL